MDWNQIWTIVGANILLVIGCVGTTITLFLWARSEASEDRRQILNLINDIQKETKDFHARLCMIQENKKGK